MRAAWALFPAFLLVSPAAPALGAGEAPAEAWLAALAAAAGVPLGDLVASEAELRILDSAGWRVVALPLPEAAAHVARIAPDPGKAVDNALVEVQEVVRTTIGNVGHGYLHAALPGQDPRRYTITVSSLLPEAPAATPPAPAGLLAFAPGGPLVQVQGTYQQGGHTVGTSIGSNVATGPGGPYLPVRDGATVPDHKVEFLGHALVAEAVVCTAQACIGFGGFRGLGVAIYDLDVATLPRLPA
jgi:hypothetical protein